MLKITSKLLRHCAATALALACLSSSGSAHADMWQFDDDSWFSTSRILWYCQAVVNGAVVMTTPGRHTEGAARAILAGSYPASSISCALE